VFTGRARRQIRCERYRDEQVVHLVNHLPVCRIAERRHQGPCDCRRHSTKPRRPFDRGSRDSPVDASCRTSPTRYGPRQRSKVRPRRRRSFVVPPRAAP
jgi:hypothetical protein